MGSMGSNRLESVRSSEVDVRTHQPQRTVSKGFPAGATRRATLRRLAGLAAVSGVPALAACATGGQGGGAGQASERLGPNGYTFKQPVRLTYWKSLEGPRHDAQVKIDRRLQRRRSDVQVTLEHVGDYAQAAEKLTAVLAANTPPDVMMLTVDTFMPGFARLGALQPAGRLRQGRQERPDSTRTSPAFIKNGTVNGKLYQLPLARSTPVLYFNKDHFRRRRPARDGAGHLGPGAGRGAEADPRRRVRADSADGSKLAVPVAGYWWTFQASRLGVRRPPLGRQVRAHGDAERDRAGDAVPGRPGAAPPRGARLPHGRALQHRLPARAAVFPGGVDRRADADRGAHVRPRRRRVHAPMQKQRAVPGGGAGLSIINSIPVEKKEAGWEYMKFVTSTPNTVVLLQDDRLHGGAHGRREEP